MVRSKYEGKIKKAHKMDKRVHYEPFKIPYILSRSYTPDFVIAEKPSKKKDLTLGSFRGIIVESKGFFKPSDRQKMLALKEQHPELDIRMLFQRDNWLTKTKTMKYSDWCEKHGFKWAVGERIPDDWLD